MPFDIIQAGDRYGTVFEMIKARNCSSILAEEPEMSGKEAIDRSRQMMNGNKWRAFVLDLSFILWYLFGVITLGIGLVLYTLPYEEATSAELYHALKNS